MHWAAKRGDVKMIDYLLSKKADINSTDIVIKQIKIHLLKIYSQMGRTPYDLAIKYNFPYLSRVI